MNLYKESCERFTELLASSSAVPGGGGASALVGAIAIALGDMVGELTVGKKKYADVEEEIKELSRGRNKRTDDKGTGSACRVS